MKRHYEALLRSYLSTFPCVALLGVRQCGKTTLAHTLKPGWKHFDLERRADHAVIARDPDTFLALNARRITVDEAQLLPELFPALRVAIDDHRAEKGRYVITGSSSPTLGGAVAESLAGRIGTIEMSPLSWAEVTGTFARDGFLKRLQDRKARPLDLIHGLKARGDAAQLQNFWFMGGFPEPWLDPSDAFRARWVEQFIRSYLQRDIRQLFPGLDDVRYRRFLEMLGGLSGRILNHAEVARALAVSQPTARDYFDIAHNTFVWRNIPGYSHNVVKRMVKHPKGYLRDTGLLHALLRIPDADALQSHPQFGASWEAMVVEEIIRQLNAEGVAFEYSHYRTSAGAEVDLVIEGSFGRVAVEIKHTSAVNGRDLRPIRDFVAEQKARLGVVINNDVVARQYEDKIIGLPMTWL